MIALFALAAAALTLGNGAARAEESAPRVVWTGAGVTLLGGPSRDGRYFSYTDPASGNLAVREIAGGPSRLLTRKAEGSGEFAYFSAISPDSRSVAYAWFNRDGFYELRVVDLEAAPSPARQGVEEPAVTAGLSRPRGAAPQAAVVQSGEPRTLYRNEEAGFVQPCAWSPDSKQILTLLFRSDNISQIVLAPADGGAPKVLRSLNWVYPKRMDMSPDGRFIVYDSFSPDASGDRTIFLLHTDGSREERLIRQRGNQLFPLWSPDGRRIVFASDESGAMDLWELGMDNGKPLGEARKLRGDLGRFLPLGITSHGDLYYGLRSGTIDVFVTTLDHPARDAKRVTLRFPGRNSGPAWSPDGKTLAYLSRRGSENFGLEARAIVIRRLDSDDERELAPKLAHIERVRWASRGDSLLVSGSDNKGRGGLYRMDPKTAAITPLVAEAGAPFRGYEGVDSPDGRTVYYIHSERELRAGESALYRAGRLRHLASSPDGKLLALGVDDTSIAIVSTAGGEPKLIPFEGLTELDWGRDLVAGRGAQLWRIFVDGASPVRIEAPGNRANGFSLHPDGKRIALTAGAVTSEVWMLALQ